MGYSDFISREIVFNSPGGGHTQTHTHANVRTKAILRNQACAWFKNQSMVYSPIQCIGIQYLLITRLIMIWLLTHN